MLALLRHPLTLVLVLAEPATVSAPSTTTTTTDDDAAEGDAESAPTPGDRAETRIVLAISADGELEAAPTELTLRGHLTDLAITPEVELRSAGGGLRGHLGWARGRIEAGAAAVFWLERPPSGEATLYLLLDDPERLYMRALTLSEEPVETQEILGVVIRGLATSLAKSDPPPDMEEVPLPGRRAEPAADADPAATEAPEEPVPGEVQRKRARLLLGLGYAGSSYASALPWGHGVDLSVGLLGARGLALTLGASWLLHGVLTPTLGDARYEAARLRLGRGGLGLRLGYRAALGARRRAFIEPALAVRGEALVWWPVDGSQALRGAGVRVSAGPATTAGVYLGRGFGLSLTAGLDLWLRNLDLVAKTPAGSAPIAAPSTVGASVQAGLIYAR